MDKIAAMAEGDSSHLEVLGQGWSSWLDKYIWIINDLRDMILKPSPGDNS